MTSFRTANGRRVEHVNADDGMILFSVYDLDSGEILSLSQASHIDLAKRQEAAHAGGEVTAPWGVIVQPGPDASCISYVLGHWDPRYWRVVDGEPVSKRKRKGTA